MEKARSRCKETLALAHEFSRCADIGRREEHHQWNTYCKAFANVVDVS